MTTDRKTPWLEDPDLRLFHGDALEVLAAMETGTVDAVVTSPPYLDARPEYPSPTIEEFEWIFEALARVVTGGMLWNVGRIWRDGTERLWWTDLIRAAAMSGWAHWDTEVWIKPNANPIHGRVLANSHEYILVFGHEGVSFNEDAIRTEYDAESLARFTRRYRNAGGVKGETREQDGRQANSAGARARSFFIGYVGRDKGNPHAAPMTADLAEHLVSLATFPGETVLDPFAGSGTTMLAARKLGRSSVGIELNEAYCQLAARRLQQLSLLAEAR